MSAANPRYYKWYPTVSCDLGTMPFEGDFTTNDRIVQTEASGMKRFYISNATGTEFGRNVTKKVGHRTQQVWEPGVSCYNVTLSATGEQSPVWFEYHGDGVCAVKVPEGEIEPVEV